MDICLFELFSGLFVNVRGDVYVEDIVNYEERVVLSIIQTVYSVAQLAVPLNAVTSNVLQGKDKEQEFESSPVVPTQYDSPETSKKFSDKENTNRIRTMKR
ncbi:MAG: hypothetical protein EZS28_006333 [Streblomastix strix]|uniref:Uncharacterized protein n=1 Tax=Streblomastix strix TaxID=222440 RepID=A0A5J4WT53_9EUKA|nr:MAG: hypothetical protein EZS28_006333 [Streblomastix strix]